MSKIYCSNCGQLIPEYSNFCRYCGAAQHGGEAAAYRAEAPTVNHTPGVLAVAQAQLESEKSEEGKMEYIPRRHLCPRVKWSFIIGYINLTWILILLLLIGIFFDPLVFGGGLLLYFILLFAIANLAYNNFYYTVDEAGFNKEYGIIHKRHATIPYSKIQNVNITRSITDQVLNLARIDIETAGSSAETRREVVGGSSSLAEAHLPGLTIPQAKKLHDALLQNAKGN